MLTMKYISLRWFSFKNQFWRHQIVFSLATSTSFLILLLVQISLCCLMVWLHNVRLISNTLLQWWRWEKGASGRYSLVDYNACAALMRKQMYILESALFSSEALWLADTNREKTKQNKLNENHLIDLNGVCACVSVFVDNVALG